jgi:hypothetical protein
VLLNTLHEIMVIMCSIIFIELLCISEDGGIDLTSNYGCYLQGLKCS